MASRRIVGVCNYFCLIVKACLLNEVDSVIQTYRRSVQLFSVFTHVTPTMATVVIRHLCDPQM